MQDILFDRLLEVSNVNRYPRIKLQQNNKSQIFLRGNCRWTAGNHRQRKDLSRGRYALPSVKRP